MTAAVGTATIRVVPDMSAFAQRLRDAADALESTTHECPPDGSGLTPCCGKTPFELPRTDRMTVHADLVTCGRADA
jgi:hypothetical protein